MSHRILGPSGICLLSLAFHSTALAETGSTGQAWVDMDYGPFLTATVEAPRPGGNIACKGVMVRLKEDGAWGDADGAWMVFDTDTLRWSAGWVGPSIDWRNVLFDGSHQSHPKVAGQQVFGTSPAPGWADPRDRSGESPWSDPRLRGRDGKPYGPLPSAWGKWKGLYLHGQHVVMSYAVGDADVLESPNLLERNDLTVLARTVAVGPRSAGLVLRVLDEPGLVGRAVLRKGGGEPGDAARDARRTVWVFEDPESAAADAAADTDAEELGPEVLDRGLLARWTFDELTDGTVANAAGRSHAGKAYRVQAAPGAKGKAAAFNGKARITVAEPEEIDLGTADYTIAAWVRTTAGGTILAKAPAEGKWCPEGKTFFVRGGKLCFDIGWVGDVVSKRPVADGRWHHVAVTYHHASQTYQLFVDGRPDRQKVLEIGPDVAGHVVRIGYTSPNFPRPRSGFVGTVDELRVYDRVVSTHEIQALARGAEGFGGPAVTAVACVEVGEQGADKGGGSLQWVAPSPDSLRLNVPPDTRTRFTLLHWRGAKKDLPAFLAVVDEAAPPADLRALTRGGPARWPQTLTTSVHRGRDDGPFAVDVLTAPMKNPWKSWMRFGGFDFFENGRRAAVCTWSGDVWFVDGILDPKGELSWKRVATGLFQPLGLKIVDDEVFVLGRDQITILRDLDGDGETDFYECFNHDAQVTPHFHEFAMDLQVGPGGDFYYTKAARHALDAVVPQHGTLLRVARDGSRTEVVCHGFRAPNGLGVGPDGELVTSDQEGHWIPMNRINLLEPGGFYGNMMSYHPGGKRPETYDKPLCWIHKKFDRSPSAQLWVSSDRWGPLAGRMLSLSYGTGRIHHVLHERVGGQVQGGLARLPVQFPTGAMRGRFHDGDGQLYVCGLFGWGSNMTRPGGLFRVRYTGRPLDLPLELHATTRGVEIRFSRPLDRELATDPESFAVEAWNYRWTARYGSADYRVSDPGKEGHDTLTVESAALSEDGRTVTLRVPDMITCMQMRIAYDLDTADGTPLRDEILCTVHRLGE